MFSPNKDAFLTMCLIIFAHQVSKTYPLVVAANRDEFHARPTAPAGFWSGHPSLFAGKDLQAGGTWMGVHDNGRFAAITNFRDPARTLPAARSRGELTTGFLLGQQSPQDYLQSLTAAAGDYAGFNLLLGEGEELWYSSNSGPTPNQQAIRLEPGIYGLSNARLDTPWPKVVLGKQRMAEILSAGPLDHRDLASVVTDRQLASREQLDSQGLDGDMEPLLSAQFIVNPDYGTRATTTCWRDSAGQYNWREQSVGADGKPIGVVEQIIQAGVS